MRRTRSFNIVLALVALLSACGSPQTGESTQVAATSEPEITPTLIEPTVAPSRTIPPTTSPLPSPTSRQSTPTIVPADVTTTTLPTSAPATMDEAATIALIRERYATINNAVPQYRKIEQPLDGASTEGGTLEAFYDGAALRKLVATSFGEMGRAKAEYYFWDEQLFFVFRAEETYDEPFGKVVQTVEDRFYFTGNQMIRWIDQNGQEVPSMEPEFTQRQTEQLQRAQELVALLPS